MKNTKFIVLTEDLIMILKNKIITFICLFSLILFICINLIFNKNVSNVDSSKSQNFTLEDGEYGLYDDLANNLGSMIIKYNNEVSISGEGIPYNFIQSHKDDIFFNELVIKDIIFKKGITQSGDYFYSADYENGVLLLCSPANNIRELLIDYLNRPNDVPVYFLQYCEKKYFDFFVTQSNISLMYIQYPEKKDGVLYQGYLVKSKY